MPTDNVLDACWEQVSNTAQGGYHYVASNPYLTITALAIAGIIGVVLIGLGIALVVKSNQAQEIKLPPQEPTYKYEEKTVVSTVTTKAKPKRKKKTTKKKSKKSK